MLSVNLSHVTLTSGQNDYISFFGVEKERLLWTVFLSGVIYPPPLLESTQKRERERERERDCAVRRRRVQVGAEKQTAQAQGTLPHRSCWAINGVSLAMLLILLLVFVRYDQCPPLRGGIVAQCYGGPQ